MLASWKTPWTSFWNGRLFGVLLVCWSIAMLAGAQTPIQGVINNATHVTAYNPCTNALTAANTTGFFTGQKVMIIQMKAAFSTVINTANNASFGQLTNPNTPVGNYEFNRIQSITGNAIVLNHPLTRQYEFVDGVVQLVTVPEYLGGAGVNVTGVLQPPAWNPNTNSGGILVFETDGPVTLNANINANSRGFTGGAKVEDGSNGGACLADFSFSTTVPGGGFKGESPVLPWQFMALGKGPWWSGGGGGNNHNNGGGGGGNGGAGGRGGIWENCNDPNVTAGIGGYNHPYAAAQNKLYLGSGGGGGDSNNGCGTNGGDGGGLVLIIAPSINGNGNAIRANGANAPNVNCGSSSDAGGGGGAGGTIFLACPTITNITLQAQGGTGANNNAGSDEHGTGGGGAGGAVLATGGLGGATLLLGGGTAGLCQNSSCNGPTNLAQPGNSGISQTGWQVPPIDPFVYAPLQATATPTPALCAGSATGSITTTVSGGFPPYTFLWSPGGSTAQNPTGLPAGAYTGQIRDSRQCLVTVNPVVSEPPALNVTFTKTDNGCKGLAEGTIAVSASGGTPGYTYTWGDIGAGPANRANLAAGTYTLVVTDQNGCAFPTQNIVINEPPTGLTASPTQQNIACFVNGSNALGSINLNVSGAIGATNITWNPASVSGSNPTNLPPGTYSYTVTDQTPCPAIGTVTLTGPTQPLSVSLVSKSNITCNGLSDGSITVTASGGVGTLTFDWGGGITGPSRTNLAAGTYTVTVRDANNCTVTLTETLTQPSVLTVSASGTNIKCFGESTGSVDASVAGGTQPYTYAWSPLNQTTQDIFGLAAGSYSLTVTDLNGCTATAAVTLSQPASGLTLNLTPTNISCFGFGDGSIQSLATGGTPAYTYSWTGPNGFASAQPNLAALQPGAYTLVLTDANNCTIAASATLTQPAEVIVDFTTANVCFPTAVAFFDASSYGGTFTSSVWDFNDDGTPDFSAPGLSSPSFAYPAPGRYTVRLTVTTDANCVYTRTRQVTVYPKPVAVFDAPAVCLQAPTLFNATASSVLTSPNLPNTIVSYAWDFDSDGTIDQTTNGPTVNHTYTTDGTYTATLVISTNNGCRDTLELPVVVYPIPIPDFTVVNNCHTFPTPFDASGTALNPPASVLSYEWDFEGNSTIDATGIAPNHTYLAPGTYTPRLWVTTTDGCVRTTTRSVTIHPLPQMALTAQSVCQGTPTNYSAALSSIQTGSIVEYEWDFDNNNTIDTVTAQPFASVIYPDSGLFTARVTGVSDQGCRTSATFTTRVRPNPDARFSIDKLNACIGELVQFSYIGAPLIGQTLTWNFGAGIINSSLNQTYNVSFPSFPDSVGTFPISLTAISEGCTTVVRDTIRIYRTPVVDAGPDVAICKGDRIELTGAILNPSAGNCQYLWVPLNASVGTIIAGQTDLTVQVAPEDTTDYQLIAICNGCTSTPDIVRVFVATPPILVLDSTEVSICKGGSGVTLTGSVFGGVPGYAYYWSPADGIDPVSPNPVALPSQTTTYTVFVIDSMGCRSNEAQILVRVRNLPVANAGPDKAYCAGLQQGVQLNGEVVNPEPGSIDSYEYEWFPQEGLSNPFIANPFATPDVTTIYKLIVKDKYGCTSDNTTLDPLSTVVVEVRPRPVADAGPDTVYRCQGQPVRIGGVPTNAGPEYTYFWTPADGLTDPNTGQPSNTIARPLASPNTGIQTYFLIVSSNGCSSEPDFVTVITQPNPTVFVEKLRSVCPGDSAAFAGTFFPATGAYTWQWTPATGLSNPNTFLPKAAPRTTTTYSLTYTYNGCTFVADTVRVEVRPVPIVRASADGLPRRLCPNSGESVDLDGFIDGGGQEVSFEWTPDVGFETGGNFTLNPLVRPTETTTYTLTARLVASGCEVRDSVTVYVLPGVSAQIEASDTTLCAGQTLTLKARGGIGGARYLWKWTDSLGFTGTAEGMIVEFQPQATTRYILEVTEGGCRSRDTLTVRVGLAAQPAFVASSQRGCAGLTVLFENRSTGFPGGFTWDFGDGSISSNDRHPVHTYTRPGSYTVRLTILTGAGCVYFSDSVRVTIGGLDQPDFVSLPMYPAEQVLDTAVVQFTGLGTAGAVSYFWNFGDGTTSAQPNPVHEYQAPGTYNVTLTVVDTVGCSYTIEHGPYVVRTPELEVHNVFTPNGDGINDRWKPFYDGTRTYDAVVFDRWGIQLYRFDETDAGWDGTHNGNPAPAGTYFYLVQIHNRTIQGHLTLVR
jgi:gliding motility-associated-like protein